MQHLMSVNLTAELQEEGELTGGRCLRRPRSIKDELREEEEQAGDSCLQRPRSSKE
jgi:hypothetical protein